MFLAFLGAAKKKNLAEACKKSSHSALTLFYMQLCIHKVPLAVKTIQRHPSAIVPRDKKGLKKASGRRSGTR